MKKLTNVWMLVGLLFGCLVFAQESEKKTQAEPEKKALTNTIKWATASEVDNFGFDVYRSEKEDGPFAKINASPIEGAGTTDSPSYYKFVDENIDPTKPYFYYVESISMDGVREHFTPVIKAKAKISKK